MRDFKLVKPVLAFGFNRLMKPLVLTSLALALFVAPARAGNDIPLVVDAINKARQAPIDGQKWEVTANVTITSPTQPTLTAKGVVRMAGDSEKAQLGGTLPMTVDGAAGGSSALAFNLKRDGEVGIQWTIAGRPFLNRPMSFYQTIPDPKGEYLSRKIKWNGASRVLLITLRAQQVKVDAATGPRPPIRKTGDPAPAPTPAKKEPIGKRYKLTGRMVVTNSDDGYDGFGKDNTCEIAGTLVYLRGANLKGRIENIGQEQPCVTIIAQDAKKGFTLNFDDNIYLDHIFSKPETEYLSIKAFIWDEDKYLDIYPDTLIENQTRWITLARIGGTGEHTLPGDRDSENIEVYYTVTEVKDLY